MSQKTIGPSVPPGAGRASGTTAWQRWAERLSLIAIQIVVLVTAN